MQHPRNEANELCTMTKKLSILSLLAGGLLISCSTIRQPSEVFTPLDYTETDVVNAEKKRIDTLLKDDAVQALWRSLLLGDSGIIKRSADEVKKQYDDAVAAKDYLTAERLYRSLNASGFASLAGNTLSEKQLEALCSENVPGIKADTEYLPKTVADCINATVTVWVDRGIKIEKGSGYADRVIGSGFFIDHRGYIVTNHHVIDALVDPKYEGYSRLYIKLASDTDTRIPAKVVGYDSVLDLALLKAEVDAPFVLALGSSADLSVGDKVSAIGTPLGLDGTVTSGIVSAIDRKLFTTGSVLQIDAAVNSGNSGGPLIDSKMRVQAIVFAGILDYQGLNFAIPVEYLRQDLPMLFHGGERKHPWTGSYGHTKKSANGKDNEGLEVQYRMPGGSSSRVGMHPGSVITVIDDQKIDTLETMQNILRNYIPDTIINCSYTDGDEQKTGYLYLDVRPDNPGYEIFMNDLMNSSFFPIYGMSLISSSTTMKYQYMITDILKGSVADESGFSENDPVYINQVKFNDDKSVIYTEISTRKSKKGYLDIMMGLTAQLDSPYYF
jgi:S1-C subfamily serine protease